MASSGVHLTTKARRSDVEVLPTADTLNDIGLSVFTCEKQDRPCFVHESVWHTVCIHSFIQCIKTPSTWYVPGSRLGHWGHRRAGRCGPCLRGAYVLLEQSECWLSLDSSLPTHSWGPFLWNGLQLVVLDMLSREGKTQNSIF